MSSALQTGPPAKISVLIVDDDVHSCRVLEQTLNLAGFETAVFTDPCAIDPKSIAYRYQIAVLDFSMPGMTGIELFSSIRKHDPVIEAIIFTGHAGYADAIAGYRANIASWIVKPWNKKLLLSEISRVLSKQQALLNRLREVITFDLANMGTRLRTTEAVVDSTRNQIQDLRRQARDLRTQNFHPRRHRG